MGAPNQMLCLHPTQFGKHKAACGQCVNCRINHKLRWMGRMALEQHYGNPGMPGAFVTLTYKPEALPEGGNLNRAHVTEFVRELKRRLSPSERYFCVGEYGSKTLRPHYHLLHFGAFGNDAWERIYRHCWPHGHIQVGQAEGAVFNYITGYVTKKLDQAHQAEIEDRGLVPEFFSCSLKPTLGYTGLIAMARMINTEQGARGLVEHGFPRGYNLGGRYFPFFRRDRLKVMHLAGYSEDQMEHWLQRVTERSWFYLEEMEIYRNAEAFQWPPEKLTAELLKLEGDQHAEATESEIQRAIARARKFKRRQEATRHQKPLDS